MLHHRIICVGRRAQDPLLHAAENYLERLGFYSRATLVRVREAGVLREGVDILASIGRDELVIALDESGSMWSTLELSERLRGWQVQGTHRLAWIVGGADGLHANVKSRAQITLGLSRFTLPHRLAQVMLLEQLYRGHTVLRQEKYHRP